MKNFKLITFVAIIAVISSCTPQSIEEVREERSNTIEHVRADTGDQNKVDESRGNG